MFEEMPAAHGHLEKDQEEKVVTTLTQAKAISRNILVSRVTGQSATRNRGQQKRSSMCLILRHNFINYWERRWLLDSLAKSTAILDREKEKGQGIYNLPGQPSTRTRPAREYM
jgi:hypothetical protein